MDGAGLVSFLAQRVVDHSRWLDGVASVLRNEKRAVQLPDHQNCRLGKWYYGDGKEIAGKYSSTVRELFEKLEEPHRMVHQHGLAALRHHEKGHSDAAFGEAMKLTGAAREVIGILMGLIDIVRKETMNQKKY